MSDAVLVAVRRGEPLGGEVIVRCREGHLFTTVWIPGASIKALRLGPVRLQRCPVGHNWTWVAPVNDADLTQDERAMAGQLRDTPIP